MLLIMLSAIQGWSTGTCNQRIHRCHEKPDKLKFRNLTWRYHNCWGLRTYVVPSSENPVKMQVLVGPDEGLDTFAGATIQRLPWQAQKCLQTIPSEFSTSPNGESIQKFRYCPEPARMGGIRQTLTWASEPMLLRRPSSRLHRPSDRKMDQVQCWKYSLS
jgi:hypothetical protein